MPGTVHELLRSWAETIPDDIALEDDHRKLTFADWWRVSSHMATLLLQSGTRPGWVAGVVSRRSVFLPCAFVASSMLGARFVSLNPSWPLSDKQRVFDRWPNRIVLADATYSEAGIIDEMILTLDNDIFDGSCQLSVQTEDDPEEEFYLNVTSASTGQAKIAPTSHSQLLCNTRGICAGLDLSQKDVHLSLFGVFGHPHELFMRGLLLGGKTVLTENRYPRDLLRVIADTGVTAIMALPTQLGSISRMWQRSDADLSRVRIAEAGGMHVGDQFRREFHECTGVGLTPVWGSTETSGVALVGQTDSSGFDTVVDGYSIQLRAQDGNPLQGNGMGEMWVSGPAVVSRYMGDRTQTLESFQDGWYRTGDMFRREYGHLHFIGRRGGLIKAAGLKVYPLEVELAILKNPDVVDVCVVGKDHATRGEMPAAYIVARPGAVLTVAGMREFLREYLDEHKIPRLINFVHGLPRTANGKIDRKAVGNREMVPDYRGELLRSDVELVKLLNHRATLVDHIGGGFDPTWVDDQEDNAAGHNAGPVSDSSIRDIVKFIISELGKR